jgi:uncharacterized protein YndB with AHSA1/START domain
MANIKELNIERTLEAPLLNVWQAWTDPAKLQQWWGPKGVTNPTCEWEAKPGGKIYIVMLAGPELGGMAGQEWPMRGEFKEVETMKKLVFTSNALADGKEILQNVNTVTFEEKDGKTVMRLNVIVTMVTPEAKFALSGMDMGWTQQTDKLEAFVRENQDGQD